MNVLERPPSHVWEQWPPSPALPCGLWLWCRPPHAPTALMVRVPDETLRAAPQPVTMRTVLAALGVPAGNVATWTVRGVPYPAQAGHNPLLDAPLPPVSPGLDPSIVVLLAAALPPQPVTEVPGTQAIDRIAADWNASNQVEHQLDLARKQLHDTLVRVNALNRDLSSEERMHGDRQDQNDWQEARRWLRDVASRLGKLIKDHDIGMASAAGRRNNFESIYQQVVVPRRPCEGLDAIQREFETHRKTVQNLLLQMNSAQAAATQDGERRAQQVLQRIGAKVRAARTKRG
ncbi:MAG: hypothetical protein JNG89_20815 [Planctomycetaceae bacterium]|nr:hypothetical protein [Planctomycetaceae bacterium]